MVNDSAHRPAQRRPFRNDEAMLRLWVERMLQNTRTPLYVMHDSSADARRLLSPWLARHPLQLRLRPIERLLVDTPGTLPWYRLMHSKIGAWRLPCDLAAYLDYDGMPLSPRIDSIFEACRAAAPVAAAEHAAARVRSGSPAGLRETICAVADIVTPVSRAARSRYMNGGVFVLRPNRSVHAWLRQRVAEDARRPRARYMAEQGFLNYLFPDWRRLDAAYNVQGALRWVRRKPNASVDVFLHDKFFDLSRRTQKELGLFECAPNRSEAVGRCYIWDDPNVRWSKRPY
jgi:hypothetical protein